MNKDTLTYQWNIYDSSGLSLDQTNLIINFNSIGVYTAQLNRFSVYTVEVNVTDGHYFGY